MNQYGIVHGLYLCQNMSLVYFDLCVHGRIKSGRESEWGREFDDVWVSFLNSPLQSNKQDLSKIEAGQTTLNPKDFDLHRLLDIKFCRIFFDESE